MTNGGENGYPHTDESEKLETTGRMENPVRFNLLGTRYYTYDQDAEIIPLCADVSEVSMDENNLFQDTSTKEWDFEGPLVETQNLR